jgi:hypothetical protein
MQHERKTFDPMKSLKTDEAKAEYKALEEELKKFDELKPKPLLDAFVATDAGPKAPAVAIKTRKGEQQIEPGFLSLSGPQGTEDHTERQLHRTAHGAGKLDHAARQPALHTRHREPRVAVSFRARHRRHGERLRQAGRATDAS